MSEHDSAGTALAEYIYSSNRIIAKFASGVMQYYLNDRLSERLVLDGSGNVLGRQAHLPFGDDFGESGTQERHHFTSYDRDAESGSDYAVNRQYAHGVGRFMRVDSGASIANPQSLNRYAYVANDPINAVDPLGLWPWGIVPLPDGSLALSFCFVSGEVSWCEWRVISEFEPRRGERPGPIQRPVRSKLSAQRIKDFKDFLSKKENKDCRDKLNAEYPGIIDQMSKEVGDVWIYNASQIGEELADNYFPTSTVGWNVFGKNVTVSAVFQKDFLPGQQIHLVTEPKISSVVVGGLTFKGASGIYAQGGTGSTFLNGPQGNFSLEHELLHYLTGKGDDSIARDLGIDDVEQWFKDKCKD